MENQGQPDITPVKKPRTFTQTQRVEQLDDNTPLLGLDDIFKTEDTEYLYVKVPRWKGAVRFASLTAGDMLEFMEANEGPAKKTAGMRLIMKSVVDKDGNRIGNFNQMEAWKKKDSRILNELVFHILFLNGMSKEEAEKAKNVFGEAQSDASPTS